MKALVVDDCPLTREMIGLYLSPLAETRFAGDGAEAVSLVADAAEAGAGYDLICLDIAMPVMGGLEALGKIRGIETAVDRRRAVIFIITASCSPDDIVSAITDGECDDYLTKPVIRRQLLDLLQKHGLTG